MNAEVLDHVGYMGQPRMREEQTELSGRGQRPRRTRSVRRVGQLCRVVHGFSSMGSTT